MEFIYKLILVDHLFQEENWTKEDEAIVGEHFQNLQRLLQEGKLILAGKTAGLSPDTYGICIFQADSLEEAQAIMENDPAVKKGIMTAILQEYNVALYNNAYKKE